MYINHNQSTVQSDPIYITELRSSGSSNEMETLNHIDECRNQ